MRISKQGIDNRKLLGAYTVKFMYVLRAKIEELKDNNCPLFR